MKRILFIAGSSVLLWACSGTRKAAYQYTPDDKALHDTIVKLDSIFFDAYNHCDHKLEAYAAFYADTLEFYHDKGGLNNSKKEVVEGTKRNICGKVTRELVKGSIEVYPIKGFGAVEMGQHRFINHEEKNAEPSRPGKFIIFWRKGNDGWTITKVVSLH